MKTICGIPVATRETIACRLRSNRKIPLQILRPLRFGVRHARGIICNMYIAYSIVGPRAYQHFVFSVGLGIGTQTFNQGVRHVLSIPVFHAYA